MEDARTYGHVGGLAVYDPATADGVGLNMTVMSYRDRLDFGLVGDRDQIDALWPLRRGLERALDDMEEMVCGTPPPAATEPSRSGVVP